MFYTCQHNDDTVIICDSMTAKLTDSLQNVYTDGATLVEIYHNTHSCFLTAKKMALNSLLKLLQIFLTKVVLEVNFEL